MNKTRTVSAASLASIALVLTACGSEQKPVDPPAAPANQPYAEALDKARGVEATLQQQKDNIDQTLQSQENPTAE
ncbi:MAG: hypothetical protein ABW171_01630 [Steroidobacter sp.]